MAAEIGTGKRLPEGYDDLVYQSWKRGLISSPFCSSSLWLTAASTGLHDDSRQVQYRVRLQEGIGYALAERNHRMLVPLESAWLFAAPVIGAVETALSDYLTTELASISQQPMGLLLTGYRQESSVWKEIERLEARAIRAERFPATDSLFINLSEGVDGWLAGRSKRFRKRARQMMDRTLDFEVEEITPSPGAGDALFERIFALQKRTYKWREGSDIFVGEEYRRFYRILTGLLMDSGQLKATFLRRNGEDAAYILGAVWNRCYRGLQMSYAEPFREDGLGNWLQIRTIQDCVERGVTHYDLGMPSEYKARWADEILVNEGCLLVLG